MKKHISLITILFCLTFNLWAAVLPEWAKDLTYTQFGSCESKDLSFFATRFSKIPLNRTREGLDLYLQLILFFSNDEVVVRSMEMGLTGCQTTSQGTTCGYYPFTDTKKIQSLKWRELNETGLAIENLGIVELVKNAPAYKGFTLRFENYSPTLDGQNFIGGKVQVNFNHLDQNVSQICR